MSLALYSLTLQKPGAITASIVGQFSGNRNQEIVVARGSWLELLKPDPNLGQLRSVLSYNCFGILRSLQTFRIAGSTKDNIVIGSDSGRIAILEYDEKKNTFKQIHLETFGKTGVRRIVPGQYLAVDPKGRATMIASVERNKIVYVLNRDAQLNITISSPLEAHTVKSLVYALISVDVGYDNPVFAAIECDYDDDKVYSSKLSAKVYRKKYGHDPSGELDDEDVDMEDDVPPMRRKKLTYYELDLGLNHVVRKWTDRIDSTANILVQVPGGNDGPSGVLVASDNTITYKHLNNPSHTVPIPKRRRKNYEIPAVKDETNGHTSSEFSDPDYESPVYIVSALVHKMRGAFFFLLQSNYGDVYKLWLDHDGQSVQKMYIKYFDTIPLTVSLNILKSGFLFSASESGDHLFYQFEKLGDNDDETEFTSVDEYKLKDIVFTPKPLDNIQLVDRITALNPLLQTQVANLTGDDAPQIYTITGQSNHSSLRKLEHGLLVNEIVSTELPAAPIGLWTTKVTSDDEFDKYIVLSFSNETLVLSIGASVEEVNDSAFLTSISTILVQQLGRDSLLQVHSRGVRHITANKEVNEWEPPVGTSILCASSNNSQVAVGLSSNEIVYFEVDEEGNLNEYEDHKELSESPISIAIGDIPAGRVRSPFLAVGTVDSTIRILSLDLDTTLDTLSVQALSANPSSIRIMNMDDTGFVYLHIGLENGVYIMSILDSVTGELSDTRTRFLGPRRVQLFKGKTSGVLDANGEYQGSDEIVLALSTKPWIGYTRNLSFDMVPLSYVPLSYASGFSSQDCPQGIVSVGGNMLRIFTIDSVEEKINQAKTDLKYTPRRMAENSFSNNFYVIETENNTVPDVYDQVPVDGVYNKRDSQWASSISVIDPLSQSVLSRIHLEENEAAFSIANCRFESHDAEYLIVGTAKDQIMLPQSNSGSFIRVYEYVDNGLKFLHKTAVESVPIALLEFQGRLVAGIGGKLRIYDLGLKQLLRKCEEDLGLNNIMTLNTQGNRIVVGDIRSSLTFVVYKEKENRLIPFADDPVARHITCAVMLDYDTVAAGDRFGNIFVLQCPKTISDASDEDGYGTFIRSQGHFLNGQASKLELVTHYYLEDIPTSLQRASLVSGGNECIICSGLQGTIAAFVPLTSKQDVKFFAQLENLLRENDVPIAGRDHMMYRSYYAPVKSTFDGDLCERFATLSHDKQEQIAASLDRTVREIERKVADVRVRAAF
ncbi:Rse1p [Sugiyamaella lignohabitans]|uniref:Rse1p n=1 Tax=Sugiyamaella lignohabitans TaxID=796027 RepID=A0A161HHZ2_9ASCO|nr:Rse1p [Sugiyamaella lignohabitans]ANB11927.1 Rse1p [Sugiyamaella lignohabitans]